MQGGGSSGSISIRKKHRPSHPASSVSGRQPPVSDALQGLPAVGASHHADVLKERAMDDLKGYFERKGISRSRAEDFKIHIKQKGTGDGSYSVHYTDKSGEMYMSKGDVFVSLDRPARKQPQSQTNTTRANREQRNCVREMQKKTDPEVLRQQAKAAKEAEAKEKERQKKAAAADKEKRERERIKAREQAKEAAKTKKEVSKKDDRNKQAIRKDVAAEQKHVRAEALSEVLERFDTEEDTMELHCALAAPAVAGVVFDGPQRQTVLDLLHGPSNNASLGSLNSHEVENVLDVTACLQAHQGFLKLPAKIHRLDDFLNCLNAACAKTPVAAPVATDAPLVKPEPVSHSLPEDNPSVERPAKMEIVEDAPVDPSIEGEGDTTAPSEVPSAVEHQEDGQNKAEAVVEAPTAVALHDVSAEEAYIAAMQSAETELDRIQLNLLFPIVSELNDLLGLEEYEGKDPDNLSRREKKNVLEHSSLLWSLPLNQLTWPELFRMCSIMRIGQEMGHFDAEIESLLKGGQSQQYPSTRNVARGIRYRMVVRNRLSEAVEADPVLEAGIISAGGNAKVDAALIDEISDKLYAKDFLRNSFVSSNSSLRAFDGDDLTPDEHASKFNISFKTGPVDFDFSSENDLIDSVIFASDGMVGHIDVAMRDALKREAAATQDTPASDVNANSTAVVTTKNILPGVYRRCCKVWAKLAALPFAKNFIWEIDREMYPDYYQLLKDPMSLSAVAYRLSQMQYGDPFSPRVVSAEEGILMVASRFYKDVRAVCLNCITYNSEREILAAHAQKMLHALHQHVVRWVLPPRTVLNKPPKNDLGRPSIECCDEGHCMYTTNVIEQPTIHNRNTSIRCGRCSGVFCPDALRSHFDGVEDNANPLKAPTEGQSSAEESVVVAAGEEVIIDAGEEKEGNAGVVSDLDEDPMSMFYIPPTDEIVAQVSEEWVCLLCLRDDFTGISEQFADADSSTNNEEMNSNFIIDEWGPSTSMPWFLNPAVSAYASDTDRKVSGQRVVIDGSCGYTVHPSNVRLESFKENVKYTVEQHHASDAHKVPGKPIEGTEYPGGLPPQVLLLQAGARVASDNSTSAMLPQFTYTPSNATYMASLSAGYKFRSYEPRSWSTSDRLTVLRSLCELTRKNPASHKYISKLNKECTKLAKLASPTGNGTSLPVEATFVEQCKMVAGDEAVTVFREMMDGRAAAGAGDADGDDVYAQNAVVAGRCLVCKGSTFEDDCPKPDDCVLLCDGCNVEAHLRCVALDAVPSGDWYCDSCSARIAARDSSDGSSLGYLEEVNQYRSTDQEFGLLQNVIERRAEGNSDLLHNHKGVPLDTCAYCGMTELQTGSPFVVGQSRPEFDAYIDLYGSAPRVDDVISKTTTDTVVKFSILLQDVPTPRAEMPKFPLLGTSLASKFLSSSKKQESLRPEDLGNMPLAPYEEPCPVVHELCALHMFRNRVRRHRHSLRRCRRQIAERVIQLSGVNTEPLGFDENGFSYWKLPMCDDLFVCIDGYLEPPEWKSQLAAMGADASKGSNGIKKTSPSSKFNGSRNSGPTSAPTFDDTGCCSRIEATSRWIRISDVAVLIRLVHNCLSDDTPSLSSLRRKIASSFLTPDRMATLATLEPGACDDDRNQEGDEDDGLFDDVLDGENNCVTDDGVDVGSSANEMEVEEEEEDDGEELKKEKRGKATQLLLQRKKGADVPKRSTIQQESVFDEADLLQVLEADAEAEADEDTSYLQYFSFTKSRFFAIALVDDWSSRIKTENIKKGTRMIYQVHREGMSQPLAHTPLDEPWGDDGIFYFACLSFKRAGHYIVTFLVEGPGYTHIKPLVYHINVEARTVLRGAPNAWNRLNARNYTHAMERQVVWGRRELNSVAYDLQHELSAVRSVLLTIYAALPNGALVMGPDSEDTLGLVDELNSVAEPTGWNRCLDRYWRNAVFQATTAQELMECALLLEFYIARQWLYGSSAASKAPLLGALPTPHFAIRQCTLSAVALRLYCLDRVLLYDKIQVVKRGSRNVGGDVKHVPNSLSHSSASKGPGTKSRPAPVAPLAVPVGRSSRNSGGRGVPVDEVDNGRIHRAAYDRAKSKIANGFGGFDSSDSESESGRRKSRRDRKSTNKSDEWNSGNTVSVQKPWKCTFCKMENLPKARSCEACGERKPSAIALSRDEGLRSRSRKDRMKKRTGYDESDESDVDKVDSADDDGASSDGSAASSRKNKRFRDSDDGNDSGPVKKRRGRKPKEQEEEEEDIMYDAIDFDAAFATVLGNQPKMSSTGGDEINIPTHGADVSVGADVAKDVEAGASSQVRSNCHVAVILGHQETTGGESPVAGHINIKESVQNATVMDVVETLSSPENDTACESIPGGIATETPTHDAQEVAEPGNHYDNHAVKASEAVDAMDVYSAGAPIVRSATGLGGSTSPVISDTEILREPSSSNTSEVTDTSLRMLSILRRIQSDQSSALFWFPVPLKIYTDYSDKVAEPMDLGTITDRAVSGTYYGTDHQKFAADVNLVWSNCTTYNLEGSDICLLAERLAVLFSELYESWIVNKATRPVDPDIK